MFRWWVFVLVVAVGGTASSSAALAQTVGVGVKIPMELSDFHPGRLTDNLEIFGQAALGPLALEAGVLVPFSPLVVGAALKFSFFQISYHSDEGELLLEIPFFIGGGGVLISFGELSFTTYLVKAGMEWRLVGVPLRAFVEGGWQSLILGLQGTGGPFLSLGLRWDL
ncbi:MAG: hypothetical protein NZO41_02990 [Candidatus Bipolaricaulota bacterium]|nr:hypothetical protein [Candidatus Bipolaricaulota bacterium]MDW8141350.1 hypothetical protein [Candidatus Bipolaricaulota bacterium]